MTQTSDAATEDTTMSDAYSMYRKGTDVSVLSATTKTSIKIAFKLQKTESTDISSKHRDILVAIAKSAHTSQHRLHGAKVDAGGGVGAV